MSEGARFPAKALGRRDLMLGGVTLAATRFEVACGGQGVPQVLPPPLQERPFYRAAHSASPSFVTPVVDGHCHIFNANDIPVLGFLERYVRVTFDAPVLVPILDGFFQDYARQAQAKAPREEEQVALAAWLGGRGECPPDVPPISDAKIASALAGRPVALDDPEPDLESGESRAAVSALSAKIATAPKKPGLEMLDESTPAPAGPTRDPHVDKLVAFVRKYVDLFQLGRCSRAQIAKMLLAENQAADIFLPMLVDFDLWQNRPAAPVPPAKQIPMLSLLSKLSIADKLGDRRRIHPLAAFDPLRDALACAEELRPFRSTDPSRFALQPLPVAPQGPWESSVVDLSEARGSFALVRSAVELGGFVGVKLYPPVGFRPFGNSARVLCGRTVEGADIDAALRRLYWWCQNEQVPITTHAGPGQAFTDSARDNAKPENWKPVLDEFPGLRLNLGHFGSTASTSNDEPLRYWLDQALLLIDTHDFVFTDLADADVPLPQPFLDAVVRNLSGSARRRLRLIYGSDWFLDKLVTYPASRYLGVARDQMALAMTAGDPKFLTNYMGSNALRFLGFLDDDGRVDLDNKNRRRLDAFYGPHPRPPWLASA
jgi:predicted TIM-barrel fold metal-dependent hydrolase